MSTRNAPISGLYFSVHNTSKGSNKAAYTRKKKATAFVERKKSKLPSLRDIDGR